MSPTGTGAAEVEQALRKFLQDNFLFDELDAPLGRDVSFIASGILDSTGFIEVVGFLETRFGVRVGDDEMTPENLDGIGRVVAFVLRRAGDGSET
jgi:acyl carrier protein